jgi:hypothetical protein
MANGMLVYPLPIHTPCHRLGLRTRLLRVTRVQQILLITRLRHWTRDSISLTKHKQRKMPQFHGELLQVLYLSCRLSVDAVTRASSTEEW